MSEVDQQRVAGWMTLTLQGSRGCLAGIRAEYEVADSGSVHFVWRGGPLACDVSAALVAAADPSMAVTQVVHASDVRAELTVGEVSVVLVAYDPDPTARRERVRAPEREWSWPDDPLGTDGVARDCVLWHVAPDSGGVGVATVVRLPTTAWPEDDWPERGHLVVNTQYAAPTYGGKRSTWHRLSEIASIRLRVADPDWTVDDVDTWLDSELADRRRPRPFVTAVVMRDRCLMRVRTGLRIKATADDERYWSRPWSVVPSAVLSALCHTDDRRQPPATLVVRQFGNERGDRRLRLDTTLAVPTAHVG